MYLKQFQHNFDVTDLVTHGLYKYNSRNQTIGYLGKNHVNQLLDTSDFNILSPELCNNLKLQSTFLTL